MEERPASVLEGECPARSPVGHGGTVTLPNSSFRMESFELKNNESGAQCVAWAIEYMSSMYNTAEDSGTYL